MSIEIENYKEVSSEQGILATFDVYLPIIQLSLRNLKLMVSKKNMNYLRYPSYVDGEDEEGNKKFIRLFEFSKERMKSFEENIFMQLDKFVTSPLRRWEPQ